MKDKEIILWAVTEEWIKHDEVIDLSREKELGHALMMKSSQRSDYKWSQSLKRFYKSCN